MFNLLLLGISDKKQIESNDLKIKLSNKSLKFESEREKLSGDLEGKVMFYEKKGTYFSIRFII